MTTLPVQVSVKHKMLGVQHETVLDAMWPGAQRVNGWVAIPHDPTNTFMLRELGYDVPNPMLTQYDWPHPPGQAPFESQIKTAAMLTMNKRAYCLNGMGTGKTRSGLWSWDYLNKSGLAKKLLVVAPLSTLKFTWGREIFSTIPHRKYVVLHGTKAKRLQLLASLEPDIYIINHDGVKTIQDDLEKRSDIDTLIIDELAVYRNGQAARTKAMRNFVKKFAWVWGMTGAPIPTEPTDAWAQASIVTPDTVPKYFKHFREDLMLRVDQFRWKPKDDAVEKAFKALQPAVRFKLDDIIELPEAVYRHVDVELGPTQKKIYKQMAAHCYAAVQAGEITAANAGACLSKLLQISTGWVYAEGRAVVKLDNDKRMNALVDTITSGEGKLLCFVPFKHALTGISERLEEEDIEHAVVSGDTSASERANIFSVFQNTNKYKVLVAHPQCLAHGITLTRADTIVWFSPVTSLEIYDQANMRIRRVGQTHKQLFLHLQGTAAECRIYKLLAAKQLVQAELLSLFEEATANAS